MKQIFRVFVSLALALMFCFQTVIACSITLPPLRKEFRKAKSVFVGKFVSVKEYEPSANEKSAIPEIWRDWKIFSKVTFEIKNQWKGNLDETREFIAVAYYTCGCGQNVDEFRIGEEYLVFATGKNFVTVCDSDKTQYDSTKDKIKRLDKFWFRTWARIYPF